MNFLVFSSPEFMPRTKVCLDSISRFHPDSKVYLEMTESATGSYVAGLPKRRIQKLIELLEQDPNQVICLLGADCVLYRQVHELEVIIEHNNIVLCPHVVRPPNRDGAQLYQTGHANADLVVVSYSSLPMLKWLSEQEMINEPARSIFYEQTWLSALPFIFNDIYILRDPCYNFAYFNHHERILNKIGNSYHVGWYPLAMAQFSGYELGKPEKMSKYNKYEDATGETLQLFQEYDEAVKRNLP